MLLSLPRRARRLLNTALILECSVDEQDAPEDDAKPLLRMNWTSLPADTNAKLLAMKNNAMQMMRMVQLFDMLYSCYFVYIALAVDAR